MSCKEAFVALVITCFSVYYKHWFDSTGCAARMQFLHVQTSDLVDCDSWENLHEIMQTSVSKAFRCLYFHLGLVKSLISLYSAALFVLKRGFW